MEAELIRIRRRFIEKVSKALIRSLLDDLLDSGVLNPAEGEDIVEEHRVTRDQARCLIDIVWKKGEEASRLMIEAIRSRDQVLYTELGLLQIQPVPQLQARAVSPDLVYSSKEFKAEILRTKTEEVYLPMDPPDRTRLALLITNIEFADKERHRRGAEKDEENMERLLHGLGYQVVKHRNLSGQQMDSVVKEFSQRPEHRTSDSTFVVIMSHGIQGNVLGVNYNKYTGQDDMFPVNNIFTHLNTEHCRNLQDKPKVIIIQACRGENEGYVMVSDSVPVTGHSLEEDSVKEHKEKDFICISSCTPETVSFRHTESGSLMIRYIVETFNTYACDTHINDLFTKVKRRFEAKEHGKCQMPCTERVSLVKQFYLFPGL